MYFAVPLFSSIAGFGAQQKLIITWNILEVKVTGGFVGNHVQQSLLLLQRDQQLYQDPQLHQDPELLDHQKIKNLHQME